MIKRELFSQIKSHLFKKEMTLITGPRQAGKTTLMLFLLDLVKKSNENATYFNLDIESDRVHFVSQSSLINKIKLEIGDKKGFVFIDEIQRKENAGIFLKGIYDMNLPYKFILSGSGSLELKEKIHESLVGRKRIFELSTISLSEFINFRTDYRYEKKMPEFFRLEKTKAKELLGEYMNFGGYPRVILEETLEEKRKIINDIFQSYLEKDISYLLRIKKTESFSSLVKILASQIGNLTNFSALSNTLGLSVKTIKEYLWYLEKTFIVRKVSPFFKKIGKEIIKSPVYYFFDLGLRNFAVSSFGVEKTREEESFLFQNLIFQLLKKSIQDSSYAIHFWRSKDGAEVDFVIDAGRALIPIEVKFSDLAEAKVARSLKSFLKKYQVKKAYIVNLGLDKKIKFGRTTLVYLPYYKLLTSKIF